MAVPPALKTVSLLKELIAEQKNTVKAINDQTNDDPARHFWGRPT